MAQLEHITRFIVRVLDILVPVLLIVLEIVLNVMAFTSVCNGVLILLIITSPLVMILFAFWWPMVICVALLLKFTSVKSYTYNLLLNALHHIMFKNRCAQRKYLWNWLYTFLSLNLPNYISCQNQGFALCSASGEVFTSDPQKKLICASKRDNLFQIQMYHQVAITATGLQSLKGLNVLDLACGRGGGLAFLCEHFKAQSAVGIDFCARQVTFAQDTNKDFQGCPLTFYEGDVEVPRQCLAEGQESFDLIICIEAWHCFGDTPTVLKEAHRLLSKKPLEFGAGRKLSSISALEVDGKAKTAPQEQTRTGERIPSPPASPLYSPRYSSKLVIADSFDADDIERVQREFEEHFEIEQKIDITYNVRNARYLDTERTQCVVEHAYQRTYLRKFIRELFEEAEERGARKQYLVYVLAPKKSTQTINLDFIKANKAE